MVEQSGRMDVAKKLVKGNKEREKLLIEILIEINKVKEGVKLVKDFRLNHLDFPKLIEMASFNTAAYFTN